MKRQNFIVVTLGFIAVVTAMIYFGGKSLDTKPATCTPSQETQQIMEAISGYSYSMEMLVSEECTLPLSIMAEPSEEEIRLWNSTPGVVKYGE